MGCVAITNCLAAWGSAVCHASWQLINRSFIAQVASTLMWMKCSHMHLSNPHICRAGQDSLPLVSRAVCRAAVLHSHFSLASCLPHLALPAKTVCTTQLGSQLWLMKRPTLPCRAAAAAATRQTLAAAAAATGKCLMHRTRRLISKVGMVSKPRSLGALMYSCCAWGRLTLQQSSCLCVKQT